RGVDPDWPVSLSKKWTAVIREEIGFDGAIVTDALDMGAIAKRYEPLEAVLHAANAGADVLLLANNMPDRSAEVDPVEAAETLARAVAAGEIEGGRARVWASHERLDRLCRRTGG
ncbi:MAG: glycoside hydrolase family 3 N-terminal domain-containing protein, partial [Phycisphaerales bacterium]